MKNDRRGSVWRRWDFHFHTPSSFDHQAKGTTDDECVEALVRHKVAAVVVSDHHRIDAERIRNLQRIGDGQVTIFPGIELRSELGGRESIHYIGIFPEDVDVEDLRATLEVHLDIRAADIARIGDDRVYVPFAKGATCIREYGGLVSIHAGQKSNSIEKIANDPVFKRQVKTDMLCELVDILEVGKPRQSEPYEKFVFQSIGKRLPIVLGSDNHSVDYYDPSSLCWVKAAPTFEGLKMLLREPTGRLYLGDEPESRARVRRNRSKYVSSIAVRKRPGSTLDEHWFDVKLPLNHELVAVIGNKGSGKSALADVVGLLGESRNVESFSFLCPDRFRRPRENKAAHFEAEIEWATGGSARRLLDATLEPGLIESVRYLPQSFLEKLCNEIASPDGGRFTQELKEVVFSHVALNDRLNQATLEDLIAFKTGEIGRSVEQQRARLAETVQRWVALRRQATDQHRLHLEQQRDAKNRELEDHERVRPATVEKPANDPAEQQRIAGVEAAIALLKAQRTEIDSQIDSARRRLADLKVGQETGRQLLKRMENARSYFESIIEESRNDCERLGLDAAEVISFRADEPAVVRAIEAAGAAIAEATALLNSENEAGLVRRRSDLDAMIRVQEETLDAPNKAYQEYIRAEEEWQRRRAEILGDVEMSGTLNYLRARIRDLAALPSRINEAKTACVKISLEIHREIAKHKEVYRDLYRPVQEFIEGHELAKDNFDMVFEAAIVETNFCDSLLAHLSQSRKGSFHGVEDGHRLARELTARADFDTEGGLRRFFDEVMKCLESDIRQKPAAAARIEDQLRSGITVEGLLEFVFGLGYLRPHYTLRWGGKEISQLSPGERGTLLLIFYLLIDRSDIPLVIDQPEENLDNQTVFDVLVPSIKEAKRRRQIILVTHNPNLAVVCDAEQIIFSSIDKQDGNRVTYTSGAIESPEINRHLVNVLEGTWPAFDNRMCKYHPS